MVNSEQQQTINKYVEQLGVPVSLVEDTRRAQSNWIMLNGQQRNFAAMLGITNPVRKNDIVPQDDVISLELPWIKDDGSYAAAMHELGHSLGRTSAEIEAWQWAYDHSPKWNAAMTAMARWGLNSYVQGQYLDAVEVDTFLLTLKEK